MEYTTDTIRALASHSHCHTAKGRPSTGNKVFGMVRVSGHMRLPTPPAKMTHCMTPASIPDEDDAAVAVEREPYLRKAFSAHRGPQSTRILRIEQQESAG